MKLSFLVEWLIQLLKYICNFTFSKISFNIIEVTLSNEYRTVILMNRDISLSDLANITRRINKYKEEEIRSLVNETKRKRPKKHEESEHRQWCQGFRLFWKNVSAAFRETSLKKKSLLIFDEDNYVRKIAQFIVRQRCGC